MLLSIRADNLISMKFQIPMHELRRVAELYPTFSSKRELLENANVVEGGITFSDAEVGVWYVYRTNMTPYLFSVLYKDSKDNWIIVRDDWTSQNYLRDTEAVTKKKFIIFSNIEGLKLNVGDSKPPGIQFSKNNYRGWKYFHPGYWGHDANASWVKAKKHIKIASALSKFMNWGDENPLSSVK